MSKAPLAEPGNHPSEQALRLRLKNAFSVDPATADTVTLFDTISVLQRELGEANGGEYRNLADEIVDLKIAIEAEINRRIYLFEWRVAGGWPHHHFSRFSVGDEERFFPSREFLCLHINRFSVCPDRVSLQRKLLDVGCHIEPPDPRLPIFVDVHVPLEIFSAWTR